jgi:hypothetical protein
LYSIVKNRRPIPGVHKKFQRVVLADPIDDVLGCRSSSITGVSIRLTSLSKLSSGRIFGQLDTIEPVLKDLLRVADARCMARRRSEEEIQQVLELYGGSGLSQMDYCGRTGTVLSALARYLRRSRSGEQGLIRVKVESAAGTKGGFVLVLGNGRRIESGWRFADAELVRLIRLAEKARCSYPKTITSLAPIPRSSDFRMRFQR